MNYKTMIFTALSMVMFSGCIQPKIPDNYKAIAPQSKIYKTYDKFKDTTFYRHEYSLKNYNIPEVYVVKDQDKIGYRFVARYAGEDWIFFTKIYFVNDEGDRLLFTVKSYNKKTDISYGVKESIDILLSEQQRKQLIKVLSSSDVTMRLEGKYYKEYKIINTKQPMLEMLRYEGK